jgi:hypothetical protein
MISAKSGEGVPELLAKVQRNWNAIQSQPLMEEDGEQLD